MSRSKRLLVALTVIAVLALAVAPVLAITWDAYASFTTASNPNGDWSYGYSATAPYAFTAYVNTTAAPMGPLQQWFAPSPVTNTSLTYNPGATWNPFPTQTLSLTENNAGYYSILRWTAPAAGTYSIKALWRNLNWSTGYPLSSNKGLVIKNGTTTLFNGNTPTYGANIPASPVLNYDRSVPYYGVVTVSLGDTIDFIAARDTANPRGAASGDCQIQASIGSGSYTCTGHIQNAQGAPLPGVKVNIDGDIAYAATDSSGNYSMSLLDGTHTLTAYVSGYSPQDQLVTVTGPGAYSANFTLAGTGVWNLFNDYSVISPVNGSWKYGKATRTSDPVTTSTFVTQPALGVFDTEKTVGTNVDEYYTKWVWCDAYTFGSGYWVAPAGAFIGTSNARNRFVSRSVGTAPNETMSVARWTAPTTGYYSYGGTFSNEYTGNTYAYSFIKNATTVLQGGDLIRAASSTIPTVAPFYGMLSLNAGDTLDFVGRAGTSNSPGAGYVFVDATIKSGQWGVTGYVEDTNHAKIAGAKVEVVGGNQTTLSDAAGNYTLVVANTSNFSIKGSKAGYAYAIYPGITVGSTLTTQNITLPPGASITGQVTVNNPAHPPVAGMTIASTDGAYTGTTDSAGNYTIVVTKGAYSFTFYKLGYLAKTVSIDAGAGNVTSNVSVDVGYDLAYDFSNTANPNGAWSLANETSTAGYDWTSFNTMTKTQHWSIGEPIWYNGEAPGFDQSCFLYNATAAPEASTTQQGWGWFGGAGYRESKKVVATPNGYGYGYAVARFTSPLTGLLKVTGRFAGSRQVAPYTQQKVGLLYNGSYKFGGPSSEKYINGFVGTAAGNYTDSAGSGTPVYTYSVTVDASIGDKIDAVVYDTVARPGNVNTPQAGTGGWTQVDMTVTPDKTTLAGRVTAANLPGNPPVIGAMVSANGNPVTGATYQAVSDLNGYYVMSVKPDVYDVEARKTGYTPIDDLGIVLAQDATVSHNFSLTHTGVWNLRNDFSTQINPNGQWTYGYVADTAVGGVAPGYVFDSSLTAVSNIFGLSGWSYPGFSGWANFIGINNTGAPIVKTDWSRNFQINSTDMAFGGGDRNAIGGGGGAIRWTSPDHRIINLNFTLSSQFLGAGTGSVTVLKNMAAMATKTVSGGTGFAGTDVNGYTDSIAAASGQASSTLATTLVVNTGDTLDFVLGTPNPNIWTHWNGNFQWPERSMGITINITPGSGTECTSISQIKSQTAGTTVFVTTPMQLACASSGPGSFDKKFLTQPVVPAYSFYIQSDDRTQGIKCITDGTAPVYDPTYKITFTGVVATDPDTGLKVVNVQSINSAVASVGANPIGKTTKGVANTGTLVKVWGKIVSMVANPNPEIDPGSGATIWNYDYMIINDGGQDIKIPLHVQGNWMSSGDAGFATLTTNHYVAVTGIAGTTTGSDVVVYPRAMSDILDYTAIGH